jgi:hypothetical protein
MKNTLLNDEKVYNIQKGILNTLELPGDTAELGVAEGGISRLIAERMPEKKHYAYDTFTGVPNFGEHDNLECGKFDTVNYETVKEYLSLPNIVIRRGLFPDTIQEEKESKFCLVHFDGDTYESCKSFLEFFGDRIVLGGRMYFDDYDRPHCPGVKKAIDEYIADKRFVVEVTTMGQALIQF